MESPIWMLRSLNIKLLETKGQSASSDKIYFSEFQIRPSYSSIQIWPLYLVLLACNDRNNTIRALIRVSIVETNIIAKKKECSFVLNHTQCVMLFDAKCAYNEAPLDDEHILFSVETLYRVGVYVEAWK